MELFTEEFIYQITLDNDDIERISVTVDDEDSHTAMWTWCEETFGEEYIRWRHEYCEIINCNIFCFTKEQDRSWFLLRWG